MASSISTLKTTSPHSVPQNPSMATNYSSNSDHDNFRFRRFAVNPCQRRESSSARPVAAETFDSNLHLDLDFAFRLQLQEALAASLAHLPPAAAPIAVLRYDFHRCWSAERFVRPFCEGFTRTAEESSSSKPPVAASSAAAPNQRVVFAVFFKGLVADDKAGIGVAICDPTGRLIFEDKKPVPIAVEAKALVEALTAALALGLTQIVFYCH